MHKVLLAVLALVFSLPAAAPLLAQGAPPQGGADQPYTVEYYYKVQWGISRNSWISSLKIITRF